MAGDELDEHLAGVAPLAHDEVAEVAALGGLVVGLELLLARPRLDGVADRVAEVGRQQADVERKHLVPAAGAMEAERRAVRRLGERVLELVAVAVLRGGGHDRLERRLGDPAEADERVAHLRLLRLELALVGVVLEAAAAAGAEVRARRLDPVGAGREHLDRRRLGEAALHLRHARAHRVAGQAAADEDDEAVQARDAVAAVGERVDVELELLTVADRGGHERAERSGDRPAPRYWSTVT